MPLKNFQKTFSISPDKLEKSDFIKNAQKKMGMSTYNKAKRIFTEYISSRNIVNSGGYFQFAFIIGESGQAPKKDVDSLWERMENIYGTDKIGYETIKRVLGTICMICVANDSRCWFYKEDMEKREKKMHDEKPDANEYWMVEKYLHDEPDEEKVLTDSMTHNDIVKMLNKKFKGV